MFKVFFYTPVIVFILGCADVQGLYETDKGINKFIDELEYNFGSEAAYKRIHIVYDKHIGNIITALGSDNLIDNTLIKKQKLGGVWSKKSETTFELSKGVSLKDFTFRMSDLDIHELPRVVEDAKRRISKEKQNVNIKMVSIISPDKISFHQSNLNEVRFIISVSSEDQHFHLWYSKVGEFQKME